MVPAGSANLLQRRSSLSLIAHASSASITRLERDLANVSTVSLARTGQDDAEPPQANGNLSCQVFHLEILDGKANRAPEEALIGDVQANPRAATDQSGRDLFQTPRLPPVWLEE